MAITLKQSPDNFTPAYNMINWVVDSDNNTEDNFKYVADLYVSGVSTPTFFRLKQQADPEHGFAVFDVHRILENFVSHDIDTSIQGFTPSTNSLIEYDILFGEEFGPASAVTVTSGLSTNNDNFAFNGIVSFLDFIDYTQDDFLIDAAGSNRFLTDGPITLRKIRRSVNAWLGMIWDTTNMVSYMEIRTFDSDDALLQFVQVDNNFTNVGAFSNRRLRFSAGTKNLNLIAGGDISAGAQPIITDSVCKYTCQVFNSSSGATTELMEFSIDDECTKHNEFTVQFLNRLGEFDTFTFFRLSRETADIKRRKFKRKVGTLTAAGKFAYDSRDRGDVVLDTEIKDSVRVTSDWLTAAESTWLKQLVTSPEAYHDDGTSLIAIDIVNTRYESKKTENDTIFSYTLEFEFSHLNARQRG